MEETQLVTTLQEGRERTAAEAVLVSGGRADLVTAISVWDYLTSHRGSATELSQYVRRHWAVENELHWCLDVYLGKDARRVVSGHAGANLGSIRRVALSLLKQVSGKDTGPTIRLKAAAGGTFLELFLRGNPGI